ncbi:MAG: hypothetical protein AMXMBFR64_57050 [Myxococcales bacterium]
MKLMDRVRAVLRAKEYSATTEDTYVRWILRFIRFHGIRHPATMGKAEVLAWIEYLAIERTVASSTQNQALCAVLFLYREVLGIDLGLDSTAFAKKARNLPVVLTRDEVFAVIERLPKAYGLMGRLIYGAGLHLAECVGLRVRDLDFAQRQTMVRDERGEVHHATLLPDALVGPLTTQIEEVARIHGDDLRAGFGTAPLPRSFGGRRGDEERKLGWQWLFPASRISVDPASGVRRRWHIDPSAMQRAARKAVIDAAIPKRASCLTLRHSFAAHLIEGGSNVRTVQTLLGHQSVSTTMVYEQVAAKAQNSPNSPLDGLPMSQRAARGLPL